MGFVTEAAGIRWRSTGNRGWRAPAGIVILSLAGCFTGGGRVPPESSEIPVSQGREWFVMKAVGAPVAPFLDSPVLVRKTPDGAIGWILKGSSRHAVDVSDSKDAAMLPRGIILWNGGPLERDRISFVYFGRNGKIHFSRDLQTLRAILSLPEERSRVKVFLGYSGWAPGQLEDEFRRGLWIVQPLVWPSRSGI